MLSKCGLSRVIVFCLKCFYFVDRLEGCQRMCDIFRIFSSCCGLMQTVNFRLHHCMVIQPSSSSTHLLYWVEKALGPRSVSMENKKKIHYSNKWYGESHIMLTTKSNTDKQVNMANNVFSVVFSILLLLCLYHMLGWSGGYIVFVKQGEKFSSNIFWKYSLCVLNELTDIWSYLTT